MKTIDVDKFSDIFGIERNIAYGFLRFISEAGLVQTGKRPQPKGKKGKPATLFHLDAGLGERLVAHIAKHLEKFPDTAFEKEMPVTVEAVTPSTLAEVETFVAANANELLNEPLERVECSVCNDIPPESGACEVCTEDKGSMIDPNDPFEQAKRG